MIFNSFNNDLYWKIGCLMGASSVALGLSSAFGAHGLKKVVMDQSRISNWQTAAHYQLIHSVMILIASSKHSSVSSMLFTAGNLLFSGSIYLLTLSPSTFRPIGIITPIGGLCYIGGWLALI